MRVMHQATEDDDSNGHQHHEDTTTRRTHEKKTTMVVPIDGLGGIVFDNRPKPHLTSSHNATLPLALTVLDPESFPSRSKALRTIRQKRVLIRRYNSHNDDDDDVVLLGKADTRIYPRDVIFMKATESPSATKGGGCYPGLTYAKPPIPLPVVYQDDYFAIVNKPAGVVCHSETKGGYDNNSVLRVLPHVLSPPSFSSTTTTATSKQDESHNNMQRTTAATTTKTVLEFPSLVHRLDAPTSGLLVVAKTLEAARDLSRQFEERRVCKTYTALLVQPTSQQLQDGGRMGKSGTIHAPVEGKPAITRWKHVRTIPSTKGHLLHLVQFFPQTGRKHQLRQHAANVLGCPIVGDSLYGFDQDEDMVVVTDDSKRRRGPKQSIMLCATAIELTHPNHHHNYEKEKEHHVVRAEIGLPKRFQSWLDRETKRYEKYQTWLEQEGLPCLLEIQRVFVQQQQQTQSGGNGGGGGDGSTLDNP